MAMPPHDAILASIKTRMERQNLMGCPQWAPDRNGIRAAISTIEDEYQELYDAWITERHYQAGLREPLKFGWPEVRDEALDVAACALRLLVMIEEMSS